MQARNAADDADATQPAGVFRVTLSGGNLASYTGTVGLGFATDQDVADAAGNALADTTPSGADQTYTVDNAAPGFTHLERHDDKMAFDRATTADELKFRAVFSEIVTGVDAADFAVVEPGGGTATTATVTTIALSKESALTDRGFILTVSGGNLADYVGGVGIALAAGHDIADAAGHAVANDTATALNEFYTVNGAGPAPLLTADATVHEGSGDIVVVFDFGQGVCGFTPADVTVTGAGKGSAFHQVLMGPPVQYELLITPTGTAAVEISVAAGVATDTGVSPNCSGNPTLASDTLTIPYRTPIDDIAQADRPADQRYTVGTAITPLVLPAASGGDGGPYTYALNGPGGGPLPGGLGYNGSTRTLSGTPTAPGNWVLVYRISDSAGASLEVFFKVVVTAAAPSGTTPTLTTEDITLPEGEQASFDVALSHAVAGGFTVTIGPQGVA